jgi:hypothetical protein
MHLMVRFRRNSAQPAEAQSSLDRSLEIEVCAQRILYPTVRGLVAKVRGPKRGGGVKNPDSESTFLTESEGDVGKGASQTHAPLYHSQLEGANLPPQGAAREASPRRGGGRTCLGFARRHTDSPRSAHAAGHAEGPARPGLFPEGPDQAPRGVDSLTDHAPVISMTRRQ